MTLNNMARWIIAIDGGAARSVMGVVLSLALASQAMAATEQNMPQIRIISLQGESFELRADSRQVTVVHFWASWCLPCQVEMPMLDAAWHQHRTAGLAMVGIALDAGATRTRLAQARYGASFPLARLADTNLPQRMVPSGLPETLIYGRNGRLRYRFGLGGAALDQVTLARILSTLLAEP